MAQSKSAKSLKTEKISFLKAEKIAEWLAEVCRERKVLVPREEGGSIVFRPFEDGADLVLLLDATVSPKGVMLPSCQELFQFEQSKNPDDPEKLSLHLDPKVQAEPTVVFGTRPCGARGFTIFDRVYKGEKFPDPYYASARDNTLFVTLTCKNVDNTCFCNWVGGGPADPTGSDVLATAVEGGYVLEAVSERGKALLKSSLLTSGEEKAKEAETAKARVKAKLQKAPDISKIPDALLALFDDLPFWEEVSAKCHSCGACTYLCPTCYCFNISDEARGLSGKRFRTWDNCMSYQFSLEASGHNPRPTKAHRLRNRVGHKFSYYPKLHSGVIACVGCGRCIKSCPVSMDIREIVLDAIEHAKNKNKEVSNG